MLLIITLIGAAAALWLVWDFVRDYRKNALSMDTIPFFGSIFPLWYHAQDFREWETQNWLAAIKRGWRTRFVKWAGQRLWLTIDPRNVEHILKTNFDNYHLGPTRHELHDFIGKSIFNADDDLWRLQRKTASLEFSNNKIKNFMFDVVNEKAKKLVAHLEQYAVSGEKIDMQDVFSRFTLDSIVKIIFGVDLNTIDTNTPFAVSFSRMTKTCVFRYFDPFWPLWKRFGILHQKYSAHDIKVLNEFVEKVFAETRALGEADLAEQNTLFSRFANLKREGLENAELVKDMMMAFLLAGRDTTANGMSWSLVELHRNPEVDRELYKHITDPSSGIDLSELSFEDVKSSHYIQAFISEVMRLHPSVPENNKIALKEDIWPDGTRIEKGQWVGWNPLVMGRDVALWGPDALEFSPARWIEADGSCKKESHFKWPAFNAGPRLCLGIDMAQMEMKTCLMHLLHKFRFRVVKGHDLSEGTDLTLSLRHGLMMTVHPRQ